jgi:hypothetical protein
LISHAKRCAVAPKPLVLFLIHFLLARPETPSTISAPPS